MRMRWMFPLGLLGLAVGVAISAAPSRQAAAESCPEVEERVVGLVEFFTGSS